MSANRLYDLLEVPSTASPEEIRSSYRRLALRCHPDKAGPSAAAQFIEIQHAYEVLSDPQTRKIYDRYGERGLEMATSAVGTAALSAFHLKTLLMTLSLMSFACVFMVLLFMIFLVCKLDRVGDIGDSWSWPQVFGPLFALAGITTISLCCFTPAVVATLKSGSAGGGAGGVLLVALRMVLLYLTGFSFTAFVILVAVGLEQQRSDNEVVCWRLYLIPFYILAALHFLSACFGARLKDLRERFARAGIAEVTTWWLVCYAALDVVQGACSVTFAALLACRVDQVITINWFLVALPLFVSYVASYGQRVLEASAKSDLLGCCGVVGLLFQQLIAIGLPAATTVMICALLEQSPNTSLTVAKCLSPMFAVFGALVLFSCCGCCLTCCTPSEMFDPTGTDAAEHQQSRREQQQQQHDEEEGRRGQEGVVDGPQHAATTTAESGEHPTTNEPLAERQTADIDD